MECDFILARLFSPSRPPLAPFPPCFLLPKRDGATKSHTHTPPRTHWCRDCVTKRRASLDCAVPTRLDRRPVGCLTHLIFPHTPPPLSQQHPGPMSSCCREAALGSPLSLHIAPPPNFRCGETITSVACQCVTREYHAHILYLPDGGHLQRSTRPKLRHRLGIFPSSGHVIWLQPLILINAITSAASGQALSSAWTRGAGGGRGELVAPVESKCDGTYRILSVVALVCCQKSWRALGPHQRATREPPEADFMCPLLQWPLLVQFLRYNGWSILMSPEQNSIAHA